MTENTDSHDAPVTITVARSIKSGREEDYESWSKELIGLASTFPGYLGVSILRPTPATGGEYVSIYRFDSYSHARQFETSDQRAVLLDQLEGIVEGDTIIKSVTGLESWFELPEVPITASPSRHRMTAILIGVVFILVMAITYTLGPFIQDYPTPVRILILVVLQVGLMTYVFMPLVTKLFKRWLYKL